MALVADDGRRLRASGLDSFGREREQDGALPAAKRRKRDALPGTGAGAAFCGVRAGVRRWEEGARLVQAVVWAWRDLTARIMLAILGQAPFERVMARVSIHIPIACGGGTENSSQQHHRSNREKNRWVCMCFLLLLAYHLPLALTNKIRA